jgi:DNA (cytosine-5)-methyltransferase 1
LTASPLIHVDLFSGVGGFALGFEASAHYRSALLADSDYSAALTFKRNRPRAKYWPKDLRTVDGAQILEMAELGPGEIDVLTAGPPCQGMSRIGTRQLDDPRNELLSHTAELIVNLQPRLAVVENVPALTWDGHSPIFDEFAEVLSGWGYANLSVRVLDAWRYGVPQLRRRAFIVAVHDDMRPASDDLFPTGIDGDKVYARELIRAAENGEPTCPPGLSVLDAIGDLPSIDAGGGQEASSYTDEPFSDYQVARRRGASILFNHRARLHSASMLAKMMMIPEGGRNQELMEERRLRSTDGEYFSQAYARLHRHGIAQTITTYFHNPGSGRFTHYRDLRTLTVREAARFQSFDDNFIFIGKFEQQMRHVGNAVPVLLAKAIADHCAMLLGKAGADTDRPAPVTSEMSA